MERAGNILIKILMKKSKARPILAQNFLRYPKYDYNLYKLKNDVNKKNQ